MTGLPSPDIPAYYCYAIVLLVGSLVAWSTVRNLANFPDRWAFAGTWQLFLAHLAVPVILFWFLDYVSVIQDTSLFASLVVAAGYGQIFSGSVQGITLPGQSASLWSPFQAWVKAVAERIATKQKQYRDQFDQQTQLDISQDSKLLNMLETLVLAHVQAPADLQTRLQALASNAAIQKTRMLWRELRTSEPEDYGYLLHRQKMISYFHYWWWLKKGRAKSVSVATLVLSVAFLIVVWYQVFAPPVLMIRIPGGGYRVASPIASDRADAIEFRYYQWRATKLNASRWDQYRTEQYFQGVLADSATNDNIARIKALMLPIVRRLCFQDVSSQQADYILRTVMSLHSAEFDSAIVPQLLECLRTPNSDIRLRIHRTLEDLQRADYALSKQGLGQDLTTWVPAQEESAGVVETCVNAWASWWATQWGLTANKATCEGNRVPVSAAAPTQPGATRQ